MMAGTRASGSMTAAEIASTSAAPTRTAVLTVSVMRLSGRLKGGCGQDWPPSKVCTSSCGLLVHQAVHGHADALAAQAAHGNDQKNKERRDGRQGHGHQLDGVLDAANGVLHFGAAVFDLPLLLVADRSEEHTSELQSL